MHVVPSSTFKSGTLVISTHYWIWWSRSVVSSLRVSTRHTCILACGRPHLPGTLRTWTSTASTTCTLDSPSPGKSVWGFHYMKLFKIIWIWIPPYYLTPFKIYFSCVIITISRILLTFKFCTACFLTLKDQLKSARLWQTLLQFSLVCDSSNLKLCGKQQLTHIQWLTAPPKVHMGPNRNIIFFRSRKSLLGVSAVNYNTVYLWFLEHVVLCLLYYTICFGCMILTWDTSPNSS